MYHSFPLEKTENLVYPENPNCKWMLFSVRWNGLWRHPRPQCVVLPRRQIVCLFFLWQSTPTSNSVGTSPPAQRQAVTAVLKTGSERWDGHEGVFSFHHRGQPLSPGMLQPGRSDQRWWMGNGEAVHRSFTALYHFWSIYNWTVHWILMIGFLRSAQLK